jgi:chemotaxis signal transduction protein
MTVESDTDRFLVFTEGDVRYALEVRRVRESLRLPRLTVLEETAPWVVGAFDLRGELVPVVSLARCFHHRIPAAAVSELVIITDAGGHPLGLHASRLLGLKPALRRPAAPLTEADDAETTASLLRGEVILDDGAARVLEPGHIRIHARDASELDDLPDGRISAFEQAFSLTDLSTLDRRAVRCGGLTDASGEPHRDPYGLALIDGDESA